ncbi:MAG: hypothetical protein HOQ24_10585 [Mycobacteriaceae bacterium]|nr:hypothetical protein [Mycobacteriaceae bacterium]
MATQETSCCSGCSTPPVRDAAWHRDAARARGLAWASLLWMGVEGIVGLWQGLASHSIALTGWALGSVVEGLASVIVVWRFTGSRTLSETSERRAQRGVAVSFWLIAPYIAAHSLLDVVGEHHVEATALGIGLTAAAMVAMPFLGHAKRRLGARLDSGATAGEGVQNYLCAVQAAAVLGVLAVTAVYPGAWRLDPIIGLVIAAIALREGRNAWRGKPCC